MPELIVDRACLPPRQFFKTWWPILVGLLALYAPTYYDLAKTAWDTEENSHGPLVLLAVIWLVWRQRELLLEPPRQTHLGLGSIVLCLGLLLYALGRSQTILLFEVSSQIPIILGILLAVLGRPAILKLWFPLFFLVLSVPLPDFVVEAITNPLKMAISMLVEESLYALGYPIARNGVLLSIGPHELMVSDACSGLRSMFSLSALGLLYLYLVQYRNRLKNALLIASIIPIAFIANLLRVLILVLVTFYFGDAAGQGFSHGLAGMMLFALALTLLFTLDWLLSFVLMENDSPL